MAEVETKSEKIRVTAIEGHPMWFEVESKSSEYPHQVHLEAYNGNASCSCEDFGFTCLRNMKDGAKYVDYGEKGNPNPKRTRCRHIKAAIKYWGDRTLWQIAKDLKKGKA